MNELTYSWKRPIETRPVLVCDQDSEIIASIEYNKYNNTWFAQTQNNWSREYLTLDAAKAAIDAMK